jgi:hypothetical protein
MKMMPVAQEEKKKKEKERGVRVNSVTVEVK